MKFIIERPLRHLIQYGYTILQLCSSFYIELSYLDLMFSGNCPGKGVFWDRTAS